MGMTINDEINKIVEQVTETHEKFIFETIKPFCESVVEMEISKEDLTYALLLWKNYDKRLKADMVDTLEDLKKEIENKSRIPNNSASAYDWNNGVYACYEVIQQKIDKLKRSKDEQ